jgi:hypothetical protein
MNSPVTWICEKLLAVTILVTLPANTDRKPSGYLWPPGIGGGGVWKGGCSVIPKNEEKKKVSIACRFVINFINN